MSQKVDEQIIADIFRLLYKLDIIKSYYDFDSIIDTLQIRIFAKEENMEISDFLAKYGISAPYPRK